MVLGDTLKKILLAGVGTIATTAEKSSEIVEELIKKGEITVEQGKILNKELSQNVKDTLSPSKARAEKKIGSIKEWISENFGVEGFSAIPAKQYPQVVANLAEIGVS